MPKYIFVTGGVISSLGKGLTSASIAHLLEINGLKVGIQKFDPYLNVDPGTMSPFQHGEVYVTNDGAETDLDLGHYERFTSQNITKLNNLTAGQVYNSIITKERRGDFLGATVQVIPHVTNEIKSNITKLAETEKLDVLLIELGGTVGDIESLPFLEAIRQFGFDVGRKNVLYIHLTLIPYIKAAEELKTKPTQHSVEKLREIGIQPDILICRTEKSINNEIKEKIALFCNVDKKDVIEEKDVDYSIYELPMKLRQEKVDKIILDKLSITPKTLKKPLLKKWDDLLTIIKAPKETIKIAVVGKYMGLKDAYKSIYESLAHAGFSNTINVDIKRIDSEDINKTTVSELFKDIKGILVPGGFGERGISGKIEAVRFARENNIPFFGICLGMQCAVIEFARNACGLKGANSMEFNNKTEHPVISLMSEQKEKHNKGGTMRLGAYDCKIKKDTLAYKIYKKELISERHRHRYEVDNKYKDIFTKNGLTISGINETLNLSEIIEIKEHPWFIAVQFHPEFKSKPLEVHPLFHGFVCAGIK